MRIQSALTVEEEVYRGLLCDGQKTLPAKFLYDDVGSALFDAITALPEYGLTRADFRLLNRHATDISRKCPETSAVVELGSGNGSKGRLLLSAFDNPVQYRPIDLSQAALDACVRDLREFQVRPIRAEFIEGITTAAQSRDDGRMLVPFLGSNVGNFERFAIVPFLRDLRHRLRPNDAVLLGADLVKPVDQLILAYDDPAGVTAAFNRNLLCRVNREFGGNFNVRCYHHEARWNPGERRIEMHLRAASDQTVTLNFVNSTFHIRAGETIWTESSHKFEPDELPRAAEQAGFSLAGQWTDEEWPFSEILLRAE